MSIPSISVVETHQLLVAGRDFRLIDVREADEWATCRIEGAELLPLSQWPGIVSEKLTASSEALVIYCHHGGRSARAVEFLLRAGFADVKNLSGGIDAWAREIDPAVARY